jgi:hypothetical protein
MREAVKYIERQWYVCKYKINKKYNKTALQQIDLGGGGRPIQRRSEMPRNHILANKKVYGVYLIRTMTGLAGVLTSVDH